MRKSIITSILLNKVQYGQKDNNNQTNETFSRQQLDHHSHKHITIIVYNQERHGKKRSGEEKNRRTNK
jgi:uncharacterized membrane protein YgaE (UPF0421/DUF939 family)